MPLVLLGGAASQPSRRTLFLKGSEQGKAPAELAHPHPDPLPAPERACGV